MSVMVESLVLALAGGLVGAGAAYFVFNGFTATTMNWQTFSQVAFAFRVTAQTMVSALALSAVIGVFGGLFPAIRAARRPIAQALREI
jgi:putative ABC transport system permease protein